MKSFIAYDRHFKDVAVHEMDSEQGTETITIDLAAIKNGAKNLEREAYEQGLNEGKRQAENANGSTERLAQIDRMARQIEECHSTIRRRNLEIRELEIALQNAKAEGKCCR